MKSQAHLNRNPIRPRRRFRRGATAVEFAVVAPAFIIVIAVCAEFTRMSMMRNLAQNAAYEAARFVMTEGATVADGIDRANEILARVGTAGAEITINGSDGSTDNEGNVTNEIEFDTEVVTCTINIPLNENNIVIPDAVIGDTMIGAQISIRTERYRGYFDAEDVE